MAAPKISAAQQRDVEIMLTKWAGKLTWDLLVERVKLEMGIETTRQTLCSYMGINSRYQNKKTQLRGGTADVYTKIRASEIDMVKQIEYLKAEIAVLKRNNSEQLRMIERILANANSIPNLDLRALIKTRPEEVQIG